jgi:lipopolysaccharide export system protein LptA
MRNYLPILGMLLLPWTCLAQNGFRVTQETGLEPIQGEAKSDAKPKAAATPKQSGSTIIDDSTETTFDESGRVAVFLGDVKVTDPQFTLTCQKLTAYFKKAAGAAPGKPAVAEKTGKPSDSTPSAGGMDHAEAEGEVIITQDNVNAATGEVTHCVGKGASATFTNATGEMILKGWPQIQRGTNTQVATAESTVMYMYRDRHIKTVGPSKSIIQQDEVKPGTDKDASKSERKTP